MASEHDYFFKILLIGDSGVGKSSFIRRFADNTFTESYISNGVDFKIRTMDFDTKIVKLQVWDYVEDRFSYNRRPSYRGAHGIIIMYDITDIISWNNVRQWLQEIDRYACENIQEPLMKETHKNIVILLMLIILKHQQRLAQMLKNHL